MQDTPTYRMGSKKKLYYRYVLTSPPGTALGKIEYSFEEIMAYPLQIEGWEHLYLFMYYAAGQWYISEARTGYGTRAGKTKDEAVKLLYDVLEHYGREKVDKLIEESAKTLLSPLFYKPAVEEVEEAMISVFTEAVAGIEQEVGDRLPKPTIPYPVQPIKDIKLVSSGTDVKPAGSKTQHVTLTFTLEVKTV